MTFRTLLLASLMIPAAVQAKAPPVPAIPPVALNQPALAEMVKVLSSDDFEGRAPGTLGEQ